MEPPPGTSKEVSTERPIRRGLKEQNAIFLVSYQIPGTPGSELLEHHRFMISGKSRKVEAKVERFDFSSHAGRTGLREILKRLKSADGSLKVFAVHGEKRSCHSLANWAAENGFKSVVPKVGETFEIQAN